MELVVDRKKLEGHCSTGQSPQWAVVPMEEEEYALMLVDFYRSYIQLPNSTIEMLKHLLEYLLWLVSLRVILSRKMMELFTQLKVDY